MGLPKINCFYSNSNYFDSRGTDENLSLLGGSYSFGKAGTLSVGVGADRKVDVDLFDPKGIPETYRMSGAIEVKYNLPIELTDRLSLNTQLRFREMYDTEQYRVTFGGKYKIGNKNSLYASAHYTQKSDGSKNYGGWLGWSHGPRDEELQINNDGTILFNHIYKFNF